MIRCKVFRIGYTADQITDQSRRKKNNLAVSNSFGKSFIFNTTDCRDQVSLSQCVKKKLCWRKPVIGIRYFEHFDLLFLSSKKVKVDLFVDVHILEEKGLAASGFKQ